MEPFQCERRRWLLQWQHSKNIMSAGWLYLSGQLFQDESSVHRSTCISLSLWKYLEGSNPITDIYIGGMFVFFISCLNLLNSMVKLNWSKTLLLLPPRLMCGSSLWKSQAIVMQDLIPALAVLTLQWDNVPRLSVFTHNHLRAISPLLQHRMEITCCKLLCLGGHHSSSTLKKVFV